MKKYSNYLSTLLFLSFFPLITSGANTILTTITKIKEILSAILPLIATLAVIYFIWSTAQYILKEGDAKNEAKMHMIWGIVILFVMVSIWSLVAILSNTFFS